MFVCTSFFYEWSSLWVAAATQTRWSRFHLLTKFVCCVFHKTIHKGVLGQHVCPVMSDSVNTQKRSADLKKETIKLLMLHFIGFAPLNKCMLWYLAEVEVWFIHHKICFPVKSQYSMIVLLLSWGWGAVRDGWSWHGFRFAECLMCGPD